MVAVVINTTLVGPWAIAFPEAFFGDMADHSSTVEGAGDVIRKPMDIP